MVLETHCHYIPSFLNEELFLKALTSRIDSKEILIKKLEFSMGCESGDNYLSKLYRVVVTFQNNKSEQERISFMAKCILLAGDGKSVFEEVNIFQKEQFMYLNVLPQLEEYLNGVRLMPHCYYTTSDPSPILIIEDMKSSGFNIADRFLGLDQEHCKIALQKLGQYHAASMIMLQNDPSKCNSSELEKGLLTPATLRKDHFVQLIHRNLKVLADNLPDIEQYAEIIKKLKAIDPKFFLKRVSDVIHSTCKENLLVINHGDMWINNILFQYEENKNDPIDAVFIDYQTCSIGRLGIDINFFLGTSAAPEVLRGSIEDLIKNSYYPAFRHILEKFNYNCIPDLNKILDEVQNVKVHRLFCSLFMLPIFSLRKEDSPDISLDKIRKGQVDPNIFATKRFLATMKIVLFDYDRDGLLEYQ